VRPCQGLKLNLRLSAAYGAQNPGWELEIVLKAFGRAEFASGNTQGISVTIADSVPQKGSSAEAVGRDEDNSVSPEDQHGFVKQGRNCRFEAIFDANACNQTGDRQRMSREWRCCSPR
jgi:hypothetical protein